MGTFSILADVIFVQSDIFQLKAVMRKNVFSYSKTGLASVAWLDIKNYSSTFHLVTLSEEIDCSRKYEEHKNAYWNPKIIIYGKEECEYTVHFWNCGIK